MDFGMPYLLEMHSVEECCQLAKELGLAFVELKRPGQRERQRQAFVQSRLRKLGFPVFSSVDSWKKIDDVLCWCAATIAGVGHDL